GDLAGGARRAGAAGPADGDRGRAEPHSVVGGGGQLRLEDAVIGAAAGGAVRDEGEHRVAGLALLEGQPAGVLAHRVAERGGPSRQVAGRYRPAGRRRGGVRPFRGGRLGGGGGGAGGVGCAEGRRGRRPRLVGFVALVPAAHQRVHGANRRERDDQ